MDEDITDEAMDVALEKLGEVGGDIRRLDEPFRTVAIIGAAQGVIDNGGLRYFFESDWPEQPPYAVFVDGYRAIGAKAEAEAIRAAAETFGFAKPERDEERRGAFLAGAGGKEIDKLEAKMKSDVWSLLEKYIRAHGESFECGCRD